MPTSLLVRAVDPRIREDDGLEARVAGVHLLVHGFWIPAFAGMTVIAPRVS